MSQGKVRILTLMIALLLTMTGCSQGLKTEDAALIAAARTGHPGTVRDMLASGANVNVRDEHGNTALIEAARNGHDDVVRTLLGAGADVKAKNDEGKTARLLRQSGTVE